jgi:hypothetical protein
MSDAQTASGPDPSARSAGLSSSALTRQAHQERLERVALSYKQYGKVPRFVDYEIAIPKTLESYRTLNRQGILMITAICQDRDEIPPSRVYIRASGQEIELKRIVWTGVLTTPLVSDILGAFRVDAFYVLPVNLAYGEGELLVDFAVHRRALSVADKLMNSQKRFILADGNRAPDPSVVLPVKEIIRFGQQEFEEFPKE